MFEYFWCVDSCSSPTKFPPDCINGQNVCPAGTISTGDCGCDPSVGAGTDCWYPNPHTPECEFVNGSWRWCCEDDVDCYPPPDAGDGG